MDGRATPIVAIILAAAATEAFINELAESVAGIERDFLEATGFDLLGTVTDLLTCCRRSRNRTAV